MKRIEWIGMCCTILLMSCLPGSMPAQKSEKAFHKMLADTYENTVPLFRPDSTKAIPLDAYQILDTREWGEYKVSHIPGAEFVGYDNFDPKSVSHLDKSKPVLVYCSIGYRSERIGEKLQEMGFTNVQNLYGGIFWWKYLDQTVIDVKENPTERVHTYNARWGRWLLKGEGVH